MAHGRILFGTHLEARYKWLPQRYCRNELEQTCHISQGSKQEAEATLARETENRELCEDKSSRRPTAQALGSFSRNTQNRPTNDAVKNVRNQQPHHQNDQVQTH